MTLASSNRNFTPTPNSPAHCLIDQREKILNEWVNRVRHSNRSAQDERRPIIVDTVPAFIEKLAEALAPSFPRETATEGTSIATEHGGERARLTQTSPAELIKEYQILRDIILENLNQCGPLNPNETRIIVNSIDQAISESLIAYLLVHQGMREQFSILLTHDLRIPLTSIRALSDLLSRYPMQANQVQSYAVKITENVMRIDRMIQDLLDASRVQFGEKIPFEVSEFELISLIQNILDHLTAEHGERFTLKGEPIQGYWNADAFKRAIENLLVNAIKYGDPNSPIQVRVEKNHGRAIVAIHNEGPPIPEEDQENLFQIYMRAHSAHREEKRGWGLGLAMVRGMAEGHGGSIVVDSAQDRGTTFVIDVPIDSRPYLKAPSTKEAVEQPPSRPDPSYKWPP